MRQMKSLLVAWMANIDGFELGYRRVAPRYCENSRGVRSPFKLGRLR
jgi:hypothetical protein